MKVKLETVPFNLSSACNKEKSTEEKNGCECKPAKAFTVFLKP